ncbi:MAG: phosphoenolpyruvate--protein phosphotransferase [Planctomycetota bacterium]
MQTHKGIPVSPGIAIAPAFVLDADRLRVRKRTVEAERVPAELANLETALAASVAEVDALREKTEDLLGAELAKIFSFHAGMLQDEHLTKQFRHAVESDQVTAAYAVYAVLRRLADTFLNHQDRYFRERVTDIYDLQRRILKHLTGGDDVGLSSIDKPCVVVAHDLTPSQTATLDKTKVRALITDLGGRTSHTAILAHALGIPAIVGVTQATDKLMTGQPLIVDGDRGIIVTDPDAAQLLEYRNEVERIAGLTESRKALRELPARTKDGTDIELSGNIEFPNEIADAIENGAHGIGLYRTEFLYLAADHEPSEDEQYDNYVEAIRNLDGRPLTVRTLDLGADKLTANALGGEDLNERNPFLGCRSIRLCLQNLPMFKRQLRAILRASGEGPVKIMFPLISQVMELRQAKMVLGDVREDLEDAGIPVADHIPIGMMIEVPSAALQARTFADEVDFFSIGTNDLIQYTLAVDRGNERIASLYSAAHPAVLALLKEVIRTADRTGTDVSLCGEMAGQPEFTMLLLGLGLRRFSMTPPAIPEIKQVLRAVSVDQCRRVARKASQFDTDREVLNYLRDELGRIMPEAFDGRSIGY